jgi:hypothetical protein
MEFQVMKDSGSFEGANPSCICGAIMKLRYTKPELRRLEKSAELERRAIAVF